MDDNGDGVTHISGLKRTQISSSISSSSSAARKLLRNSPTEKGKSPNPYPDPFHRQPDPKQLLCRICTEPRIPNEAFTIKGCSHAFCRDCLANYVAVKLQDNVSSSGIACPVWGCPALLEPEQCASFLPSEVFQRWGTVMCEALIFGMQKFHCPFDDCSAVMHDDGGGGVEVITQAECPNCFRLFCARCEVPWHPEIGCIEFQKLRNELGERSISSSNQRIEDLKFLCEICTEPRSQKDSFPIRGCSHAYCKDCTAKYIAAKLQDNVSTIGCPIRGCEGMLEPGHCGSILPPEVFERWGSILCENVILGSRKFYCPFKDCSAVMLDDGGEVIAEAECPNCCRLFCARCRVPWHSGIRCDKFQKLHKDEREREDIMLMNLADQKRWKRCPKCRIYVEKTKGCNHMVCRYVWDFILVCMSRCGV
ncbi:unnamed protein product [Linum trigynum]|uniref:RBR-type E3 ubiquitin transferase n=1 Tax=Linum trigynum TaxID=586398 RepID=A0AAV2EWV1_9ROSI